MDRPTSAQLQPGRQPLTEPSAQQNQYQKEGSLAGSKKLSKRPTASRLTPANMLHDQERLYSETMNLKQVIHELENENTRLRTKLAFLDKENTRLSNYIIEGESASGSLCLKSFAERESNSILINLKKLLRHARGQIAVLEESNIKLKRTVKYTKINELEFDRKALMDEAGRLKAIVNELLARQSQQSNERHKIQCLTRQIRCRAEENETLLDVKEKYEQIIASLEKRLSETEEAAQDRESKLIKDLKEARVRIQDNMRKQQIYKNYIATLVEDKQNTAKLAASNSTLIQKGRGAGKGKEARPATAFNKRPESALHRPNQLKRNEPQTLEKSSGKKQETTVKPHIPSIPLSSAERAQARLKQEMQTPKGKQTLCSQPTQQKEKQPTEEHPQGDTSLLKEEVRGNLEILFGRAAKNAQGSRKIVVSNKDLQGERKESNEPHNKKDELPTNQVNYEDDFEESDNGADYNNDFEAEQDENGEQQEDEGNNVQRDKQVGNSNRLVELSELLGLRLRAQQYPLSELLEDIEQSCPESIQVTQLADLLQKEPFYLTPAFIDTMLKVLFNSDQLTSSSSIRTAVFSQKLESIVMPFELLSLEEEEAASNEVCELLSIHWEDLMAALEKIGNGDGTVTHKQLQQELKRIGMTPPQVDMVISDLSLSCADLSHLQYLNLYEIYFQQREEALYEQEPDINRRHTIREEEDESMSNDRPPRRVQQLQPQLKNSSFSMRGGSLGEIGELPSGLI